MRWPPRGTPCGSLFAPPSVGSRRPSSQALLRPATMCSCAWTPISSTTLCFFRRSLQRLSKAQSSAWARGTLPEAGLKTGRSIVDLSLPVRRCSRALLPPARTR
eukprot:Amastigsp_a844186_66.p3 type:complete len:104 gc:universal Amastigsp_a844186_66:189-500(+)